MEYQACELIAELDICAIYEDMHEFEWNVINYEFEAVTAA
jgi:hypothetical protein